jgi:hypothetical protein
VSGVRRFEAFPSKTKLMGLFVLNVAMVAMCVFCITLPQLKAQVAGWAGTLFFGSGLFVIPWAICRTSIPKIIMDDTGIHTRSSIGIVDWQDITGFRIDSIKGTRFLSVFVQDVDKYLDRMPAFTRKLAEAHPSLGVSEIALNFAGLTPGLADACRYLAERGYHVVQRSPSTRA